MGCCKAIYDLCEEHWHAEDAHVKSAKTKKTLRLPSSIPGCVDDRQQLVFCATCNTGAWQCLKINSSQSAFLVHSFLKSGRVVVGVT